MTKYRLVTFTESSVLYYRLITKLNVKAKNKTILHNNNSNITNTRKVPGVNYRKRNQRRWCQLIGSR